MLKFLGKTVPFQRHFTAISSTTLGLPSLRNQWLFVYVKFISSRSTSRSESKGQSFTVSYLISTCGFSPEAAAFASKRISFETAEKPDSVIAFFRKHGFSQTQTVRIVKRIPELLRYDPQKTFLPKIEFLKSRGVLSSDIPKILTYCPDLLRRSLENQIKPSLDCFKNLFPSGDNSIKAFSRFPDIVNRMDSRLLPNIKQLGEEGVPDSRIIKLLELYPRSLSRNPDVFKKFVEEVKEMGFNPLRITFILAVHVLASISKSTWARKADLYKRWGWTDDDILAAFLRHPFCMSISEESIEAKLEYYVHKMGCKSNVIARRPELLLLSLNKRIIPRGSVIQVLLSKGLVTKLTLSSIFECTEKIFLEKFILCHEKEAGELLKIYQSQLDLARPAGFLV